LRRQQQLIDWWGAGRVSLPSWWCTATVPIVRQILVLSARLYHSYTSSRLVVEDDIQKIEQAIHSFIHSTPDEIDNFQKGIGIRGRYY
jgi:hypothetical protein